MSEILELTDEQKTELDGLGLESALVVARELTITGERVSFRETHSHLQDIAFDYYVQQLVNQLALLDFSFPKESENE
jgi:hypothetical protein